MKTDAVASDSSCIDFLVSILVRFPQIFAIRFNNTTKSYIFTFMYRGSLAEDHFAELKVKIKDYFEVYKELNDGFDIQLSFKKRKFRKCTFIEIFIDGDSLNIQDINLLASTMAVELGENVVSDYEEFALTLLEGEDPDQEREVEYLSRTGISHRTKENLILFRDSGKVYVFDK